MLCVCVCAPTESLLLLLRGVVPVIRLVKPPNLALSQLCTPFSDASRMASGPVNSYIATQYIQSLRVACSRQELGRERMTCVALRNVYRGCVVLLAGLSDAEVSEVMDGDAIVTNPNVAGW